MMNANITRGVRKGVYRRDGYRCALCDSTKGLQVHHIVPRSHGGNDKAYNLITLCWKCHAVAHGTTIRDYPPHIDKEWIEQSCIEYISDWYAEVLGETWDLSDCLRQRPGFQLIPKYMAVTDDRETVGASNSLQELLSMMRTHREAAGREDEHLTIMVFNGTTYEETDDDFGQ